MNSGTIRADGSGYLQLDTENGSRTLDFNALYKGYYPRCGFTAAAVIGDLFYAAGTDREGMIRLFSSASGETWTEINTQPMRQTVRAQSHGEVIAVQPGAAPEELLLILEKGWCLYLPDCPRCVELIRLTKEEIRSAGLENETLFCVTAGGSHERLPLADLPRLKVGWAWAERHHALLFDLLARAVKWLQENTYTNPIYKWNTPLWGEIPADFGRK